MKLLLVSVHHAHPDSIGALRPRAMAKYLPRHGVEVDVLTSRVQREDVTYDGSVIGVRDVTRQSASLPVYVAWRLWQKGLRALGFHRDVREHWRDSVLRHADEILARSRPDAILATYPPVEALQVGVGLARRWGLPLVSDFRDGLLFEPLEVERMRSRSSRRAYEALEAEVMERSRTVLTVSEPISAYFRETYGHPDVVTLYNGFDPEEIPEDLDLDLPPDAFHLAHTGRLSGSRVGTSGRGSGVEALRAAVRTIQARSPEAARRLRIHFMGELSDAERESLAPLAEAGLVRFWGQEPRARALALQRKADVLLLVTAPDQASVATGKLFEYLAAGKPILALTRGTEAERIVRETGAGVVVPPDDPERIAQALEALLSGTIPGAPRRDEARIAAFARPEQMAALARRLDPR
jgi:glycosyltransferase involved in cell wall biosynthesis